MTYRKIKPVIADIYKKFPFDIVYLATWGDLSLAMSWIAKEMDINASQLAIAWILRRADVSSVILGATKVEQLKENLKTAEIEIPEEVINRIDKLFPLEEYYPNV